MPRITLSGRPAVLATGDLLVLPVVAAEGAPLAPPSTRAVLERPAWAGQQRHS